MSATSNSHRLIQNHISSFVSRPYHNRAISYIPIYSAHDYRIFANIQSFFIIVHIIS